MTINDSFLSVSQWNTILLSEEAIALPSIGSEVKWVGFNVPLNTL